MEFLYTEPTQQQDLLAKSVIGRQLKYINILVQVILRMFMNKLYQLS